MYSDGNFRESNYLYVLCESKNKYVHNKTNNFPILSRFTLVIFTFSWLGYKNLIVDERALSIIYLSFKNTLGNWCIHYEKILNR